MKIYHNGPHLTPAKGRCCKFTMSLNLKSYYIIPHRPVEKLRFLSHSSFLTFNFCPKFPHFRRILPPVLPLPEDVFPATTGGNSQGKRRGIHRPDSLQGKIEGAFGENQYAEGTSSFRRHR